MVVNDDERKEFEKLRKASRLFEEAATTWTERALKAEAALASDTHRAELQLWFDVRQAADMMALSTWRSLHPDDETLIPEHADLVIWLLDQLAGINRIERTDAGLIDWKMEAERANRLLDSYEQKYSMQAIATAEAEAFERGYQSAEGQVAEVRQQLLQAMANDSSEREAAERCARVDTSLAKRLGAMIETNSAFKVWLVQWLRCYALDIFPEPDLAKAAEVLKAGGLTIDSLSANMGRHVLGRVIAQFDSPDSD
jgi:hypothetical protein